jgi:hypothetical protein
MNPDRHAVASLLVGVLFGLFISPDRILGVTATAFLAGTLIDVDHFLIARWRHGDWRYMKTTFSSFWTSLHDIQSVVDDEDDIECSERLLTHAVILVVLLIASSIASEVLLDVAALSTAVHLLMDIYADSSLMSEK